MGVIFFRSSFVMSSLSITITVRRKKRFLKSSTRVFAFTVNVTDKPSNNRHDQRGDAELARFPVIPAMLKRGSGFDWHRRGQEPSRCQMPQNLN